MTILVTGAAGFIGFHLVNALCSKGETVIGIDNLNDYYDVSLKEARLKELEEFKKSGLFIFYKEDISNRKAVEKIADKHGEEITEVIHLAAQAGVRYSLENPFAYVESNLVGHVVILETCRHLPNLKHMVYASSSSVYGGNTELPFSVDDKVDTPISLYAATKKADELMSHAYSHLYKIPMTGLRFFTVYGPWGRPDMAYFIFTKAISEGAPIKVFGRGHLKRDFTYIDDIVAGILAVKKNPPDMDVPHSVYNLGNDKSVDVNDFISVIEGAVGKKAIRDEVPVQPGDMLETHADITATREGFRYDPKVKIQEGIPIFVDWYKGFYNS
jgi:UDP-glucuronate 4-epimerase